MVTCQGMKEGEDTTKKMLNMRVSRKRRRGGSEEDGCMDNIRYDKKEYNGYRHDVSCT